MNQNELDNLVHRTIKLAKEDSEDDRRGILNGRMEPEQYNYQCGYLSGMDYAITLMIDEAKKLNKEIKNGE